MKKRTITKINSNHKKIKKLSNAITELEKKISEKRKEATDLDSENRDLCTHPKDKIIDVGGQVASICECSICGHIVSVSG